MEKCPVNQKFAARNPELSWSDYRVKQHSKFLPEPSAWLGSTQFPILESAHAYTKF
jgi:hypothetical protein